MFTPNDVIYDDGGAPITINAKYTYGKYVKGLAEISISRLHYSWDRKPEPLKTKRFQIDGVDVIEFDIRNELKANPEDWESIFEVEVKVIEEKTGKFRSELIRHLI